MNDVSYGCIARLLADSLVAAVDPEADVRRQNRKAASR
jgi:hypothetical protein